MNRSIPKQLTRGRKAMIRYLAGHARYHTMNGWNQATSYAHCIKVDRLGLDSQTIGACLEMLEVSEAFAGFNRTLEEFGRRHQWRWQIGQNGRSGGYLVLYQGGTGRDGHAFCWPGKNLDMNADFSQWETAALRLRTDLVWDFDRTCRQAAAAFVEFARTHKTKTKEIMAPQRIKIAVVGELRA